MKVLLDVMGISKAGGGRTASIELLKGLAEAEPSIEICALVDSFIDELARIPQIVQKVIPVRNRFVARVILQVYLPWLTRRKQFDIVHHAKNLSVLFAKGINIVTIYDMANLTIPQIFPKVDNVFWRFVQPALLRRANHIIAISDTTALDLKRFFGIADDRITTIYLSVPSRFRLYPPQDVETIIQKLGITTPYVIHVGSISPKKNLRPLLTAFAKVKDSGWTGKLVLVGDRYLTLANDPLDDLMEDLQIRERVIFTGGLPDDVLPPVLAGADLFVFTSLYEGFGLVLIEAMASGVPIIGTSTGAIPEVVSDAGMLIKANPTAGELAEAMATLLNNPSVSARYREMGLRRSRMFTSKILGTNTIEVYRRLLEHK